MGSRLRGNNGRRAARFLEGLGMTGGALRMPCRGGCVQSDMWGREERGDGFPPPSSRGQALCRNDGWDWGNGFPPTREKRQAGGEIPRGTRNDRGRCVQNDMGGALGMTWREEGGYGFPPRLHGGRLCAGKTVGRENGGGRAVPEPPLRIATNLGLNALWSVYFHSNNMETSWVTPQGCRQRYEGGAWGEGSRRRKTLYGFHRLLDRSKRTTPRNRPSRE